MHCACCVGQGIINPAGHASHNKSSRPFFWRVKGHIEKSWGMKRPGNTGMLTDEEVPVHPKFSQTQFHSGSHPIYRTSGLSCCRR